MTAGGTAAGPESLPGAVANREPGFDGQEGRPAIGGVVRHGTDAGYQHHRLAKTPPCEPCREAHRIYLRDWRRRKAAEADPGLPTEAVDTVALALELELGGQVSPEALRWAAVIALRTALALLNAERPDAGRDTHGPAAAGARQTATPANPRGGSSKAGEGQAPPRPRLPPTTSG